MLVTVCPKVLVTVRPNVPCWNACQVVVTILLFNAGVYARRCLLKYLTKTLVTVSIYNVDVLVTERLLWQCLYIVGLFKDSKIYKSFITSWIHPNGLRHTSRDCNIAATFRHLVILLIKDMKKKIHSKMLSFYS